MSQSQQTQEQEDARRRASIILQVRNGRKTVRQAAKELGISRKTYYEWENRALEAMVEAMEKQPNGRPAKETDPGKEALQRENQELKDQLFLAQKTVEVKNLLVAYERQRALDAKKNEKMQKKRPKKEL
jgi:transposase